MKFFKLDPDANPIDVEVKPKKPKIIVKKVVLQGPQSEPYRCKQCFEAFYHYKDLNRHIQENHEIDFTPKIKTITPKIEELPPNKCLKCGEYFEDFRELNKHITFVHEKGFPNPSHENLKCFDCGKQFFKKEKLQEHFEVAHLNQNRYQCKLCDEVFISRYDLVKHQKAHKPNENQNSYKCEFCGEQFAFMKNFRKHVKELGHNILKCGTCRIKLPHLGCESAPNNDLIQDVTCNICAKVFCSAKHLNKHTKYHMRQKNKSYIKCDFCEKLFKDATDAEFHVKVLHPEATGSQCDFCEEAFVVPQMLQFHLKEFHQVAEKSEYYVDDLTKNDPTKDQVQNVIKSVKIMPPPNNGNETEIKNTIEDEFENRKSIIKIEIGGNQNQGTNVDESNDSNSKVVNFKNAAHLKRLFNENSE